MATTGGSDQLKPGREGYSWGTDGETIGPPEPQSTLRMSYTGATRTAASDETSARLGLEDVTPPSSLSLHRSDMADTVYLADETSLRKTKSGRRKEIVTQPAVHGTFVDNRSWLAGGVPEDSTCAVREPEIGLVVEGQYATVR